MLSIIRTKMTDKALLQNSSDELAKQQDTTESDLASEPE